MVVRINNTETHRILEVQEHGKWMGKMAISNKAAPSYHEYLETYANKLGWLTSLRKNYRMLRG